MPSFKITGLDDFPTVDIMGGSLAHMVCSKEARQSLTQVRGDQELPYQVAAIEAEDSEIPGWQRIYYQKPLLGKETAVIKRHYFLT